MLICPPSVEARVAGDALGVARNRCLRLKAELDRWSSDGGRYKEELDVSQKRLKERTVEWFDVTPPPHTHYRQQQQQ